MHKSPALTWDERGSPRSESFDDKYFCTQNGYADAMHVFCGGNHLQERFAALDPATPGTFTIVETGFGTGLDFCCAWKVWQERAPASWKLDLLSVEKFPISSEEVLRALAIWPLLDEQARILAAAYKPMSSGIGVFDLGGKVQLTIVFDDIVPALATMAREGLAGKGADVLFLDGFAPSKNPEMWNIGVYAGLAVLSKPTTTLATFTAAGHVRRGLEACGFGIRKEKGYGGKKHMLAGDFRGISPEDLTATLWHAKLTKS